MFESLQLADFGNRIPTLTFEVIADDGDISLASMMPQLDNAVTVDRTLSALAGFSEEGGPLAYSLETIGQIYPFSCDASGQRLSIGAADALPAAVPTLAEPAIDSSGDSFGTTSGESRRRQAETREIPGGLRYYDLARDYQAGLQRADGRARQGRSRIIEFPGALDATDARNLANAAAERAAWSKETMSWRMAELDPSYSPGQVVRVPGKAGLWRITDWEWRSTGVELELLRLPHGPSRIQTADAGQSLPQTDVAATQTVLEAFELPWDGSGSSAQRQIYAAASSAGGGWTGAALYADSQGALTPIGSTGRQRCIIGQLATQLQPGTHALIASDASMDVELVSEDFQLAHAALADLAGGANRALVGGEIIQFASATRLGGSRWRLSAILRGRGGTENLAQALHPVGTGFVLLDGKALQIDPTDIGQADAIAASGLADAQPVFATIGNAGRTLKPLTPVHPRIQFQSGGGLLLEWTRRARGAWEWLDFVDAPLNEPAETYLVGVGDVFAPAVLWEVTQASLQLDQTTVAALESDHPAKPLWVRQVGSHAASDPLLLHMFA